MGARSARQNTSFSPEPSRVAIFSRPEISPAAMRRAARSTEPTALSTARDNSPGSRKKRPAIHPQFTLNPQLANGLPTELYTLDVAIPHGWAPKSSGTFSCPDLRASIQGNRVGRVHRSQLIHVDRVALHAEGTQTSHGTASLVFFVSRRTSAN